MRAALLLAAGLVIGIGAGSGRDTHAQGAAGTLNLVVVCVKCIPDAMPKEDYNSGTILLDQNTGALWFYPALSPGVRPRRLGTLAAPGQPVTEPGASLAGR